MTYEPNVTTRDQMQDGVMTTNDVGDMYTLWLDTIVSSLWTMMEPTGNRCIS